MRLLRFAAPVGGVVAAGTSVVCMASMGAVATVSTAGGMAGMGVATISAAQAPDVTRALRAVGLGGLTKASNGVMQPLLIVLLLAVSVAALWHSRVVRRVQAVALAVLVVVAAVGLYACPSRNPATGWHWRSWWVAPC